MSARVHIPALLRRLYATERIELVEATTIAELVDALDRRYPGMAERLLEPDGSLRRYVHIFVDGEDIRAEASASSPLRPDAQVWIVPNVAGGM
jgi:molybdopterin synthase sulfur carrier subunit